MHFDWSTLALQTINFAILVWLLHRFLYKPVLSVIDVRRREVEKQFADARAADSKAQERVAAVEAERSGIAQERMAALATAATQADAAAAARHDQAEHEAATLLDGTRKTIAREREVALDEARTVALDLGAEAAGRFLMEVPSRLQSEAWLERIVQSIIALPQHERDSLIGQLDNGGTLDVVTALPLPTDAAELWRTHLHRALGDKIVISFAADPRLIAGAELHFPNAVLRFSWQSALAGMRAKIGLHDNAR